MCSSEVTGTCAEALLDDRLKAVTHLTPLVSQIRSNAGTHLEGVHMGPSLGELDVPQEGQVLEMLRHHAVVHGSEGAVLLGRDLLRDVTRAV